jgi:K+/H+ antiporter YhaU regulatory subunit KhtT
LQGMQLDELSRYLVGATTDIFSVPEESPLVGRRLGEIDLRERSGATLIVAVRDGKPLHNVGPEFVVEAGDRLVLLGDHRALDEAAQVISPRAPA